MFKKDANMSVKVVVVDVIGRKICVSSRDGDKLFQSLVPLLDDGKHVVLSFKGVTMIISAFLNNAIGKLYSKFKPDRIDSLLVVEGMSHNHQRLLDQVKESARLFYENPEGYRRAMAEDE